ncbi:hypothetical protein [Luteimonas vadosa]|uniref:DUF2970 domain-containing protein n=1 Tax=Luteimonas vadosa TaxID=1165507 RepID=A0ABP9DXU0_9GAMM
MLHLVRLIERRNPSANRLVVPLLVVVLTAALALGVALLVLR